MARETGVKEIYLIKINGGKITHGIRFVDDYRPNLVTSNQPKGIDRRYAIINKLTGCIWYNDTIYFENKEAGNKFYLDKKAEGFVIGTEKQYDDFVRKCANITN